MYNTFFFKKKATFHINHQHLDQVYNKNAQRTQIVCATTENKYRKQNKKLKNEYK